MFGGLVKLDVIIISRKLRNLGVSDSYVLAFLFAHLIIISGRSENRFFNRLSSKPTIHSQTLPLQLLQRHNQPLKPSIIISCHFIINIPGSVVHKTILLQSTSNQRVKQNMWIRAVVSTDTIGPISKLCRKLAL